jgi:hypothetical protein
VASTRRAFEKVRDQAFLARSLCNKKGRTIPFLTAQKKTYLELRPYYLENDETVFSRGHLRSWERERLVEELAASWRVRLPRVKYMDKYEYNKAQFNMSAFAFMV